MNTNEIDQLVRRDGEVWRNHHVVRSFDDVAQHVVTGRMTDRVRQRRHTFSVWSGRPLAAAAVALAVVGGGTAAVGWVASASNSPELSAIPMSSDKPEPTPTGSTNVEPSSTAAPSFPPGPTVVSATGPLSEAPAASFNEPDFVFLSAWGVDCDGRYFYVASGSLDGRGELIAISSLDAGMTDLQHFKLLAPAGFGALTITSGTCAGVNVKTTTGQALTWMPGADTWT